MSSDKVDAVMEKPFEPEKNVVTVSMGNLVSKWLRLKLQFGTLGGDGGVSVKRKH